MRQASVITLALFVAGCQASAPETDMPEPSYQGITTQLLEGDLVNFHVDMASPASLDQLEAYARCAAAQYALIRGFGFARHVRTNFDDRDGIAMADAVYTISAALPRGIRTIDAEVTVAACREEGIPTV